MVLSSLRGDRLDTRTFSAPMIKTSVHQTAKPNVNYPRVEPLQVVTRQPYRMPSIYRMRAWLKRQCGASPKASRR